MLLQINDLFWTLQGEGRWSGHRALFVRMPFCNYNCPWCDTEFNSYKNISEDDFITFCQQEPARFAVITGGEPLAHKQTPQIIKLLKQNGFYIACETNGSFPAIAGIDFNTVSPKAYAKSKDIPSYFIHSQIKEQAHEFKYVVDTNFNFSVLDQHKPYKAGIIYSLSPEYSQMKQNLERILDFIKHNPQWNLSLQTHKWINIP